MIPPALLTRRLRRVLAPQVQAAASRPEADRYRKHFPARAHLWILLGHVLSGSPSLRRTYAHLSLRPAGWQQVGLDHPISFSQLARSSSSRPAACLEDLLAALLAQLPGAAVPQALRVRIRDSSFLRQSAKLSPWSRHKQHVPGVRLQLDYDLGRQVPRHLHLTLADTSDVRALAEHDLRAYAGWTLLIDLGYYGHQQFQRLRDQQVDFICPLQRQATVVVTQRHPVRVEPTPAGDTILADEIITLGSPSNRHGAVLPQLRRVTSRNAWGQEHQLVTSRHDLTAQEVVSLYRQRWQIELLFRWRKHHLGLLHPLGTSRQALWATILLAAIAAVLAALLRDLQPATVSTIAWLGALADYLPALVRGPG